MNSLGNFVSRVHDGLDGFRESLGDALSLSWLRAGNIPLGPPIGGALVVWYSLDQLGRSVDGLPFWVCWPVLALGLVLAGSAVFGSRARTPAALLLAELLALWLLYAFLYLDGNHLYDLDVYLGSAQRWADGGHAYMTGPLTIWPSDARSDYFLYPPVLLPLFALLARLPDALLHVGWVASMVVCEYAGFRLLGMNRRWSVALLVFPPVFIGFESGNVAALAFLLFAAGARAGSTLVVDVLFKVQFAVPVLWLVRERRFRALAVGVAVVAVAVVATLPLVGPDQWREWWAGLGYRATSQLEVPALFGYSYAKDVPGAVYMALSAVFVVAALAFRGRRGLAALGLASVFASPTLWPHGFVFCLPALLLLESDVACLTVLGIGSIGSNMWLLFIFGWLAVLAAPQKAVLVTPRKPESREEDDPAKQQRHGRRPWRPARVAQAAARKAGEPTRDPRRERGSTGRFRGDGRARLQPVADHGRRGRGR